MPYNVLEDIGYKEPVFNDYFLRENLTLTTLLTGGLVASSPEFNAKANEPGMKTATMPFFNDLTGDSSIASDDATSLIVPGTISTGQDICTIMRRTKSWGSTDYIKSVTQGQIDPLRIVISRLSNYWTEERQKLLTCILRGVIQSNINNNSSDMVIDISSTTPGKRKYHTYLFAPGAIALGIGRHPNPLSVQRNEYAGTGEGIEAIFSRHTFLLHPRGIAWQNAVVSDHTPTNADLYNPLNWSRVWHRKEIRFACIISNANVETGVTADNCLSPDVIIDALGTLGDRKSGIGSIMMHQAVEKWLEKLDIIDVVPNSVQGGEPLQYYNGRRVLINDEVYNWVA